MGQINQDQLNSAPCIVNDNHTEATPPTEDTHIPEIVLLIDSNGKYMEEKKAISETHSYKTLVSKHPRYP